MKRAVAGPGRRPGIEVTCFPAWSCAIHAPSAVLSRTPSLPTASPQTARGESAEHQRERARNDTIVETTSGNKDQLIRPGGRTQAHRQTSSAVYHVFAGEGYRVIDGQRFDWRQGDFFALPPWAWHEYANEHDEEAILFSIQDTVVFETLGLYREEAYVDNGGHQSITSVLEG